MLPITVPRRRTAGNYQPMTSRHPANNMHILANELGPSIIIGIKA